MADGDVFGPSSSGEGVGCRWGEDGEGGEVGEVSLGERRVGDGGVEA